MKSDQVDRKIVVKMVKLSNLKVDKKELPYFIKQFNETIKIVQSLRRLRTKNVPTTNQVTKLANVFRKDVVDRERVLSQKQALSNAKNSYQGYFVTKAVFDE